MFVFPLGLQSVLSRQALVRILGSSPGADGRAVAMALAAASAATGAGGASSGNQASTSTSSWSSSSSSSSSFSGSVLELPNTIQFRELEVNDE